MLKLNPNNPACLSPFHTSCFNRGTVMASSRLYLRFLYTKFLHASGKMFAEQALV